MRKSLVLLFATMSLTTFAQTKKAVLQPPVTEFNFEGDLIDGTLSAPDVEYFIRDSKVDHPSLIKVRESFKEKIMNSAGEL